MESRVSKLLQARNIERHDDADNVCAFTVGYLADRQFSSMSWW